MPQFDPNVYAALHSVSSSAVTLVGVEVQLDLEVTAMEWHLTLGGAPCTFDWCWPVQVAAAPQAALGTPTIQTSPVITPCDNAALAPGANYDWTLQNDYSGPTQASACAAVTGDLSAYLGTGTVSWPIDLFAFPSQTGCSGSSQTRFVRGIARLTVLYTYCIDVGPPTEPGCDDEGCSADYWKKHPERWDDQAGDDFTNNIKHVMPFNGVLGVNPLQSGQPNNVTLLEATDLSGGALEDLARQTAAALAGSDTAMHYPDSLAEVIALYRDAVGADAGPQTVSSVTALFQIANETGWCPLDNGYQGSAPCLYCFADQGNCPCGNDFASGGCRNGTGQGGALSVSGSSNWVADDLVLSASNLPPTVPVIWIAARDAQVNPLADGLLCIGPGVIRRLLMVTNSSGAANFGPGIVQMSMQGSVTAAEIFPGSTWRFQAYYRDPGSPCGNGGNLTNAALVTFH